MSKKAFAIVSMLVVLSMLLVACGGTATQAPAAPATQAPAAGKR